MTDAATPDQFVIRELLQSIVEREICARPGPARGLPYVAEKIASLPWREANLPDGMTPPQPGSGTDGPSVKGPELRHSAASDNLQYPNSIFDSINHFDLGKQTNPEDSQGRGEQDSSQKNVNPEGADCRGVLHEPISPREKVKKGEMFTGASVRIRRRSSRTLN